MGHRLGQAEIDIATATGPRAPKQGHRNGLKSVKTAGDIGGDGVDPMGNAINAGIAGDKAGEGLRHRVRAGAVTVRAGLPIAAEREIDQFRMIAGQGRVIDA